MQRGGGKGKGKRKVCCDIDERRPATKEEGGEKKKNERKKPDRNYLECGSQPREQREVLRPLEDW